MKEVNGKLREEGDRASDKLPAKLEDIKLEDIKLEDVEAWRITVLDKLLF